MYIKKLKKDISMIQILKEKGITASYNKLFRCPTPSHEDKTPSCIIFQNTGGDYIKCFGCGFRGDVFDLIGILENIPDFRQQYIFLKERYGNN